MGEASAEAVESPTATSPPPEVWSLVAAPSMLRLLQAARLRTQWHRLLDAVLHHAYLVGLADEISPSELRKIGDLAATEAPELIHLSLANPPQPTNLQGDRVVELIVQDGAASYRLPALGSEEQWDWERTAARLGRIARNKEFGTSERLA